MHLSSVDVVGKERHPFISTTQTGAIVVADQDESTQRYSLAPQREALRTRKRYIYDQGVTYHVSRKCQNQRGGF